MIRPCNDADFEAIYSIINDAAQAYRGVIPEDRWHEPYMPREELHHEIESGVRFWGYEENGELLGVMGIQDVQDVTLIRHAYVRTTHRNQGIGGGLLTELRKLTSRPILIGTGKAGLPHAAIGFAGTDRRQKATMVAAIAAQSLLATG